MFTLIVHSGITSAQLDMTAAFAPLGIGLLSLLAVSAGMIVWVAVRSRLHDSVVETAPVAAPPREQKMAA
jgi:hypothetical protein